MKRVILIVTSVILISCNQKVQENTFPRYSGIYPHLAYYNNEGECGTGAVVPWAGSLWVITYGPHLPFGSSDKLYEITPGLKQIVREESIGGTPANRMIHKASNQLFIGPYVIDRKKNVRVIPYDSMPGRLTGNAIHLYEPDGKIYYGTMEEGFYEVDVKTLKVNMLYRDGNVNRKPGEMAQYAELLPGAHGKGLYSGQGVLVYSNNGEANQQALTRFDIEAGALAEWNGKDWRVVRRNQFTEVTGPGGIYGNKNPGTDPIWATGWDNKSVIVGVRDREKGWTFYRLPKASHSYDGAHGWNTEWPRIRNIGNDIEPDYLMTMHGMFWRFPGSFTAGNTAGIRPRSAYLKVIGDFARWDDRLVFGCDDAANKEFLNTRRAKGSLEGPGQSNSNLWFTPVTMPDSLGPATAEGAVWLGEEVKAGEKSEPFLFTGWDTRSCWISNEGNERVLFTFEVDRYGNNQWEVMKSVETGASEAVLVPFGSNETGEWVRVSADRNTKATVHFTYSMNDVRKADPEEIFKGVADVSESEVIAGLMWGTGDNRRTLGIVAGTTTDSVFRESGYYELDASMRLTRVDDTATATRIRSKMRIPHDVVTIDQASVLVVDDKGRRWRLPKGKEKYGELTANGLLRICREVATERDLFNCSGTLYELPAENADGYARIRPVASHNFRIHDYASYRGLLVMSGINPEKAGDNPHIIVSEDGKAALWAGVIDDLWKIGKPVGEGGPWKDTEVKQGVPSDTYLIGFYDKRTLKLSHDSEEQVTFRIEAEPAGHDPWMKYSEVKVRPGETYQFTFPRSFQSRWIRFVADRNCRATAWLKYE